MEVDEVEQDFIKRYREVLKHGHGRVEVIVKDGHMETTHHTFTVKRRDILSSGQLPS